MLPFHLDMAEEREHQHRRSGDDESFVSHMRAADQGISIGRRWVEIVILLVGFGVTIGMNWQRFNNLSDKVDQIAKRQDASDTTANSASVAAQVAKDAAKRAEQRVALREVEMDDWRATFHAIAMIQQQGGGRVTLKIPAKAKETPDGGQQ